MPAPFEFDFKNPDYASVYAWRMERLERIRNTPGSVAILKEYYKDHPADFINHWGMTYDPRQLAKGMPTSIPFVLFDRQEEWIDFIMRKWRAQERGLTEKSRDMGVSWLVMSLSCTLAIFNEGVAIGVGSRLEKLVDMIGNPDTLFFKARFFMSNLPVEFRGGWIEDRHAPYMRIIIPDTGSFITGEAGDNIGRGGRNSIYFVDEAAYLGIPLTGDKKGALDVADQGADLNAFGIRHGIEVNFLQSWSGKGGDLLQTAEKAFFLCDDRDTRAFDYDADGLGASVRGDSNAINSRRVSNKQNAITVGAFRGSGEVVNPKKEMVKGRKNQDFFMNRKAQAWWSLRLRFQETHRAVQAKKAGDTYLFDIDNIISIDPKLPELSQLTVELSQPTYSISTIGKILINKSPEGTRSPNLADCIMMLFAPVTTFSGFFS